MPAKKTRCRQTRAANRKHQQSEEGTARSPRPPASLPGTLPPPRDGSTFRSLRFGQYRRNGAFPCQGRTGKRLRGGSICRKRRIEPACIICGRTLGTAPAKRPSFPDGGLTDAEKERNHDSTKRKRTARRYATATTEAEFHEALNRGYAVELTRELADQIGVPMDEDVGTVEEVDAARHDRHD